MARTPNFENSKWQTAALLKMVLSLYLSRESSDLNEILVCRHKCWFEESHMSKKVSKFCKFKMAAAAMLKTIF